MPKFEGKQENQLGAWPNADFSDKNIWSDDVLKDAHKHVNEYLGTPVESVGSVFNLSPVDSRPTMEELHAIEEELKKRGIPTE